MENEVLKSGVILADSVVLMKLIFRDKVRLPLHPNGLDQNRLTHQPNRKGATERSLMDLFSKSYRPYTFGAFGKPTTREIHAAVKANRVVCYPQGSKQPSAAALFTITRQGSYQVDFAKRKWFPPTGTVYVRHLGVLRPRLNQGAASLFKQLSDLSQNKSICVEIFEENKPLREAVEALGFRYVMSKIMASSEIRGLYCNGVGKFNVSRLPAADVPSLVCLAPNFISASEREDIIQELNNYLQKNDAWQQHYSNYNKRQSWTAFSLRGYCRDPGFIIRPAEMSKTWKIENPEMLKSVCKDTQAARSFRLTRRIIERIPGVKERVRFMRLAAGHGELSRHADITNKEAGTKDNCLLRLHIPLITHDDVLFEAWDARGDRYQMHFAAGGLYYLDQRKPHRVMNRSPAERIHLIVDVYATRELRLLGLRSD